MNYDQPMVLLNLSNKDTRDNPSVVTAMKITIAITETIIAYSTAVAPFCSLKNLINCFILHLFYLIYVQLYYRLALHVNINAQNIPIVSYSIACDDNRQANEFCEGEPLFSESATLSSLVYGS